MYPELIRIGPFPIHTYGLFAAIGFLAAVGLAVRQAKKQGMAYEKIADLSFWLLLSALLGSRVFYVLVNISYYLRRPLDVFKMWEGGLVFYGGLALAVPVGIWYIKRKKLDLWQTVDVFAPSLAIAHAIGRLGCFSAGCCYGKPTDVPWAVTFKDPQALAPLGISVHPTQLYESLGEFAIFVILIALRNRQMFKGGLFWTYGALYSSLRFIVEFLRGDMERGFILSWLSVSQALSIALFAVSVMMLLRFRKQAAH